MTARKLKVAFGSVPKDGGTFTFYRNLRPSMLEHNVDLRCVTVGRREARLIEQAYVDEGCVLLAAKTRSVKRQARIFAEWCEKEQIDIVMAINSVAILSALPHLPKNIRVISRCANAFDEGYRITMSGKERLMRIIALTPRLRDDLVAHYGADPSLIELIPNGIDPKPFCAGQNISYAALTREPQQPLQLGFLGRLEHRQKGVLYLPEIVKELKRQEVQFHLRIAGKGKHEAELRKRLRPYIQSGEVELVGALTKEEVPQFLKYIDVYLFTSHFEGCPNALLEAMMAGCVPVAFLIEGITDFVLEHGKTGFVVPAGDNALFAKKVSALNANPLMLNTMKAATRNDAIKRFIPEVAAARYAQIFNEVITGPLPDFTPLQWSQFAVDSVYKERWTAYVPDYIKHIARKVLN